MNILIGILTVLLILLSVFIVLVVLIQKPRADSGLGTAMGGGMAEATFGAETGNVLTRATIVASIAFFVLAFSLYLLQLAVHKRSGATEPGDALPKFSAPATPAAEPTATPLVLPGAEAPAIPATTPATSAAPTTAPATTAAPAGETPAAPKP